MNKILILAEQLNSQPLSVTLEVAAAARQFSASVEAVTWGSGAGALGEVLGLHGISRAYNLGDLTDVLVAPRATTAIADLVTRGHVDALFIPATYDGRDIAARLSVRLDRPVLSNVVGLEMNEGTLVTEHAVLGGSEIARARLTGDGLGIYLIRSKSFIPQEVGGQPANVVELTVAHDDPRDVARVLTVHEEQRTGPDLDSATVIVAGGRGIGAKEHFALIEQLAGLLKGAPAASRAVVDAGWAPFAYQVGQTGKIVKPDLYFACGISGAIQHLVGMKSAKYIIAINKDDRAPIFEIADLGIIGDIHNILPKLISVIEALN